MRLDFFDFWYKVRYFFHPWEGVALILEYEKGIVKDFENDLKLLRQVIVKGHLNPIIIDVKTKFFVDPIITLLSYDKNAILHHMGINPSLSLQKSFSKTMVNIEKKAKSLGITTYNFPTDIYDEMIATHKTYSEIYSFETLCSVLRKHKVLYEFADELIEEVYLWPEYHEFIADVIIDKLFPVLKTVPPIKTNAILVECK